MPGKHSRFYSPLSLSPFAHSLTHLQPQTLPLTDASVPVNCTMKNSIPSDVWEKKKALIARLYKDEEWPLKQVIKQIRTKDFNPRFVCPSAPSILWDPCLFIIARSETQLRSRLKKWRVTKPSRQTRKKPADAHAQADNNDDDEDDVQDEMSPVETKNIPTPQQQSQSHVDLPSVIHDWYSPETWVQPPQQSQPEATRPVKAEQAEMAVTSTWSASVPTAITTEPHVQQQQNLGSQMTTPVVSHFPAHSLPAAYDLSQHSPQTAVPTTHMLSPTYVAPYLSYPQSAPRSAMQWPTASDYIEPDASPSGMGMPSTNWFTAQYDATSSAPPATYYQRTINSMSSNYSHVMQPMPPQDMNSYQPQPQLQPQPQMATGFQNYDENAAVRPWRRAVSSQFQPEATPGYVRVDRQSRQRKPAPDRKHKDSPEEVNMALQPQMQPVQSAHHNLQAVMPPQYIAAGHHSMMPHDIYAYAGHEQLLQRPIGH